MFTIHNNMMCFKGIVFLTIVLGERGISSTEAGSGNTTVYNSIYGYREFKEAYPNAGL